MELRIITTTGTRYVDSSSIDPNQIGQKGLGLLTIPSLWSIPFVCIGAEVFLNYAHIQDTEAKRELIVAVSSYLRESFTYLDVSSDDSIIIRSSGIKEGMFERGHYDSLFSTQEDIENTLAKLFDGILTENEEIPEIAFVVQKYFPSPVLGHLSNERRFSRVKRDWVFEYSTSSEKIAGRISIRHWRNQTPANPDQALNCNSISEIDQTLRRVADYYTREKQAVHLEFLWDKSQIILVQADTEALDSSGAENPMDYDISVTDTESLSELQIIRRATEDDVKFKKIDNQYIYRSAGLAVVPLFILSGKENIDQIRTRQLSPALEKDLRELTRHTIVIRSDIVTEHKKRGQLLPRSNDLHSYEEAVQWLFGQTELLDLDDEIAFIFHIFVPAIGAAFVDASPFGRIVEIEALWGLPEGLYYNAHDKITVDTKMLDAEALSPDQVEIKKKQCAYKEFYIAPNDTGKWVAKRTAQPYDWQCCINDESIRQVAVESRKIATLANKRVSVMWFIGIDKSYYGTSNLAWFHEPYETGTYTASHYKKKYFYEVDTVIKNKEDYANFLSMPNVREIKLCPTDDALLRDKLFLENVGKAAKEKNASILLEGTMLAHPLYQLLHTGAKVFTTQNSDNYGEEENYNKLVRDNIPDKIMQNGEQVSCFKLERDALLRALIEKTVEEACEIVAADSPEALLEELGDEYEVLSAIKRELENITVFSNAQLKTIQVHKSALNQSIRVADFQFDLLSKASIHSQESLSYGSAIVGVSYEGTQLQIEVHFVRNKKGDNLPQLKKYLPLSPNSTLRSSILKEALTLSSARNKTYALQSIEKLYTLIEKIGSSDPCWDKAKFCHQISEKRKKRGGFEKGYMLVSSSLKNPDSEQDLQQELFLPSSDYKTLSLLGYPNAKNVDFLNKGDGELLIRISLPLCFDHYEAVFDSNSTKKYIGPHNQLIIVLDRKENSLNISIFEKNEPTTYIQTQLEI